MTTKKITLTLFAAVFAAMFLISMISAASLSIVGTPTFPSVPLNHDAKTFTITFNLKNAGVAATLTPSTQMTSGQISSVNLNKNNIANGQTSPVTETITATLSFPSYQNGNLLGNLVITPDITSGGSPALIPFSVQIKDEKLLEVTEPTTLTQSSDSTFTITNTGNIDLTVEVNVDKLKYNGNELNFSVDGEGLIEAGKDKKITISSTIPIPNDNSLLAGQSTTVHINTNGQVITKTLNVETSYCSNGEAGVNLKIDRIKFTNLGTYGDRDEWYLLGEIEAEIRVKNTRNDDVDNIIVEWGLYNKDSGEFIVDNEENDFDLKDGDTETLNIKFTLDPNDFNEDFNEDDFIFLVKAYSDYKDVGEDLECNSARETIKVLKDKHFVILDDIVLKTDSLPCNELLEGQFDIWNIGANDEQDVEVVIFNEELGIDQRIKIGDLDILEDKKSVPFSLRIPQDAEEKSYELEFKILDEDGDVYENDADDEAKFMSPIFGVSGSCAGGTADLIISAELDPETPEAVAGKKINVKATLRNRGDKEENYTISVQGNSAWSTLDAIDPQVVTIAEGESTTANIILNLNSDAEGSKEFIIRATTSEGKTTEQRVQVPITKTPISQQNDLATHISENWFIYVIIIVNIILIIAIIMVIRRMVSPAPL